MHYPEIYDANPTYSNYLGSFLPAVCHSPRYILKDKLPEKLLDFVEKHWSEKKDVVLNFCEGEFLIYRISQFIIFINIMITVKGQ